MSEDQDPRDARIAELEAALSEKDAAKRPAPVEEKDPLGVRFTLTTASGESVHVTHDGSFYTPDEHREAVNAREDADE
jgi:hypothetical protein